MSPLTQARPDGPQDRRPLHVRTVHPEPVEGCFGCRIAQVTLVVPIAFRGIK